MKLVVVASQNKQLFFSRDWMWHPHFGRVPCSCYISGDLAEWLEDHKIDHVHGAPFHPQTQGKIERWHQIMKNRVLLENYYLPGDLERQIEAFVDY